VKAAVGDKFAKLAGALTARLKRFFGNPLKSFLNVTALGTLKLVNGHRLPPEIRKSFKNLHLSLSAEKLVKYIQLKGVVKAAEKIFEGQNGYRLGSRPRTAFPQNPCYRHPRAGALSAGGGALRGAIRGWPSPQTVFAIP
jgi:hypothetical protein